MKITNKDQADNAHIKAPIIGYHRSPLSQKFGLPRQPNLVELISSIELIAPYNTPEAFDGIEHFSHLWLTWHTHQNNNQSQSGHSDTGSAVFKAKVRPPRLGGNDKLGVFATRSTYRPSKLGLSVVKLIKVDVVDDKVLLYISGADMVDGTPIVDIKPYIAYSDAIEEAVSGFAPDKPPLKPVVMSQEAQRQFDALILETSQIAKTDYESKDRSTGSNDKPTDGRELTQSDVSLICALIAQDPRPAYRQNDTERIFYMRYKQYDIGFKMQGASDMDADSDTLMILSITTVSKTPDI